MSYQIERVTVAWPQAAGQVRDVELPGRRIVEVLHVAPRTIDLTEYDLVLLTEAAPAAPRSRAKDKAGDGA